MLMPLNNLEGVRNLYNCQNSASRGYSAIAELPLVSDVSVCVTSVRCIFVT